MIAEQLGYRGVWAAEVAAYDGFALLAAVAARTDTVQLGTAIVPVSTRSPALMAMGAATLCGLAPGRVVLGIGVSSRGIVEGWHGVPFDPPVERIRDTCRVLDQIFAGHPTDYQGGSNRSTGFSLACPVTKPPSIHIAALGPKMRAVAATMADGVILNFLPRSLAARMRQDFPPEFSVSTLVRVAVTDTDDARWRLRREMASYLRFDQYRGWLADLGYADAVASVDQGGTLDERARLIPDDLLEEIAVIGDQDLCRAQLAELFDAGVTPLVLPVASVDRPDLVESVVRAVAPGSFDMTTRTGDKR